MHSRQRQTLSQKCLRKQGVPPLHLLVHHWHLGNSNTFKDDKEAANFLKQFGHLCPKAPTDLFSCTTGFKSGILQVTEGVLKLQVDQTLKLLD